jgi:hypothetical protein
MISIRFKIAARPAGVLEERAGRQSATMAG